MEIIRHEALVHAIVWYASKRGEKLTTLRLVKFLYLADLYNARVSTGRTLTGWPWAFVYFGPWCQQANESINTAAKNGLVVAKEFPSKYDDAKDYRLFWVEDTDNSPKSSPPSRYMCGVDSNGRFRSGLMIHTDFSIMSTLKRSP